jgi:hypothetical protein
MRPPHGGILQGPLSDTRSRIYSIFSALSPASPRLSGVRPIQDLLLKCTKRQGISDPAFTVLLATNPILGKRHLPNQCLL